LIELAELDKKRFESASHWKVVAHHPQHEDNREGQFQACALAEGLLQIVVLLEQVEGLSAKDFTRARSVCRRNGCRHRRHLMGRLMLVGVVVRLWRWQTADGKSPEICLEKKNQNLIRQGSRAY